MNSYFKTIIQRQIVTTTNNNNPPFCKRSQPFNIVNSKNVLVSYQQSTPKTWNFTERPRTNCTRV